MLKIRITTKLLKNLLLSIDILKNDKIGLSGGSNYEYEMVAKSLSKNSNKAISYLTLNGKQAFT